MELEWVSKTKKIREIEKQTIQRKGKTDKYKQVSQDTE